MISLALFLPFDLGALVLALLLAFGLLLYVIEPRLSVTGEEVEALVDDLIAKHGPDAERVAWVNHHHVHDRCENVDARAVEVGTAARRSASDGSAQ